MKHRELVKELWGRCWDMEMHQTLKKRRKKKKPRKKKKKPNQIKIKTIKGNSKLKFKIYFPTQTDLNLKKNVISTFLILSNNGKGHFQKH